MAGVVFRAMTVARKRRGTIPRPFLKWVGGKGQLLPELLPRVELAKPFGRYHEPFVGGGALFFDLARKGWLTGKKAWLSDMNRPLIETYAGVKDDVEGVIALLREHESLHSEEYYYAVRGESPEDPLARAARIIYLNKTCYNGLYRENSKGGFNTPFGRYVNPAICDEENLRGASVALRRAKLEARPFESVVKRAAAGDLVYFDPPYHPVSATSSFTGYDRGGFNEESQRGLAEVCIALDRKGVKFLLSNSDTDFIRGLYEDRFRVDRVFASRSVNSRGDGRGKVAEALVRNF